MRAHADVDAVTLDALGTLVRLRDPVPALQEALRARGRRAGRSHGRARRSRAEVAHYKPRCAVGRDAASLAALREECVGVFLREARTPTLDGGRASSTRSSARSRSSPSRAPPRPLERARRRGAPPRGRVELGHAPSRGTLAELGLAARARARSSPRPPPARASPTRRSSTPPSRALGSTPERTLHVGDEDGRRGGRSRAGLRFRPAPLAAVAAELLA